MPIEIVNRPTLCRQQSEAEGDGSSSGCWLRYLARLIKIKEGQEKMLKLRYGAELIHLTGREEKLAFARLRPKSNTVWQSKRECNFTPQQYGVIIGAHFEAERLCLRHEHARVRAQRSDRGK